MLYYQLKIDIDEKQAYKNITNFVKFFELEDIIESKIEMLSKYEQAYLKILSLLIIKPRILGIDDMLTYLNINQKLKIINFVKNNKITILNCTTNPEELLFGTDIIILDHKRVVAYEKSEVILSSNKYLSIKLTQSSMVIGICLLALFSAISKKALTIPSKSFISSLDK